MFIPCDTCGQRIPTNTVTVEDARLFIAICHRCLARHPLVVEHTNDGDYLMFRKVKG